jgi:hypothetical protein
MKFQAVQFLAIVSFQTLVTAHPHSPATKPRILISRKFDVGDVYSNWPSYDQLPLDPSYPTKAAWGVWVRSIFKSQPD